MKGILSCNLAQSFVFKVYGMKLKNIKFISVTNNCPWVLRSNHYGNAGSGVPLNIISNARWKIFPLLLKFSVSKLDCHEPRILQHMDFHFGVSFVP